MIVSGGGHCLVVSMLFLTLSLSSSLPLFFCFFVLFLFVLPFFFLFSYIFGGSFELVSHLFISSLGHLQDKRVNTLGVAKLLRNCFALQQCLTNIEAAQTQTNANMQAQQQQAQQQMQQGMMGNNNNEQTNTQESHFDRARQYVELLNYTQDVRN